MVRIVCFGLLGPLIGYIVFLSIGGGFRSHALEAFMIVFPFAILAGLIPALITAGFDLAVDRKGIHGLRKCLLTGAFGYVAAYLLSIENVFELTPLIPTDAQWGIIGAIPALICSWITDRITVR